MQSIKFGLFGDLHLDIMHDGEQRLQEFLQAAMKENVDFLLFVGDFCYPEDTKRCDCSLARMPINLKNAMEYPTDVPKLKMLKLYQSFPRPTYMTIGNHELDFCTKEFTTSMYKMKKRYYSFQCKDWCFIVLDGNNYKDQKGIMHDSKYGDYFDYDDYPYIDDEQFSWLEKELTKNSDPTIIVSHQPFAGNTRVMKNSKELFSLFDSVRSKVKMCLNGHTHIDQLLSHQGIWYYTINSMSNYWIGPEYACKRYADDIEQKYPNLKYTFPYKESLYTFVTLDDKGCHIKGKTGDFVPPGPKALGLDDPQITASVKERQFNWF